MSIVDDRLKGYANPTRRGNWQGASRDQANIDRWSEWASENSQLAPRAKGGEVKPHPTGKQMALRDTGMQPKAARKVDAAMSGKGDVNYVGPYMPSIPRKT